MVQRYEVWLLAIWTLTSIVVVLAFSGAVTLAGFLELDLYRLYSFGAVLGWLAGNVYVVRRTSILRLGGGGGVVAAADGQPGAGGKERFSRLRWRLLLVYLIGPPSMLYLLRALAPASTQQAAPLVPLLGFGVYLVFFLVPVTLKTGRTPAMG